MNRQPWYESAPRTPDESLRSAARAHQDMLTKPAGSLGRLEALAIRLCSLQGTLTPAADKVAIVIFAGDHGVVAEGVSAFPQLVTVEMMKNFTAGGAAISVLARHLDASLEVVNVGSLAPAGSLPGVIDRIAGAGTANFCVEPAMNNEALDAALQSGRDMADAASQRGAQVLIGGEMGIGNTTAATAILSALLDISPDTLAGAGTGLDSAGVHHKAGVVARAIALHAPQLGHAREVLRHLGGFEIAALTGFYIAAAQAGRAVLVDGFICTAAALVALRLNPAIAPWLIFSHVSAEQGYARILDHLPSSPLLDLGLRLGEGSGAAVCVPLLRAACALHNQMATFAQAQVSTHL